MSETQQFYSQIETNKLSNTQLLGKSILSLSSAGLALTLTFLNFIVPIEKAVLLGVIKFAWGMFALAISCVIASYITSQKSLIFAQQNQQDDEEDKISDSSDSDNNQKFNWWKWITSFLNWEWITSFLNGFSAFCFIVALVLVVIFATTNINEENMTKNDVTYGKTRFTMDGAPVPKMQKKGAPVPVKPSKPPSKPANNPPKNTENRPKTNIGYGKP